MGITKTEGFDSHITELADQLKVLGHPGRLAIVEFLAKSPSCICNDIVDELPLAQPTISKHLSELKRVGVIQGQIEGKNICYCIDSKVLNAIQEGLKNITVLMESTVKCC